MNFVISALKQSRSQLNKLYYTVSNRVNKVSLIESAMPEKNTIQVAIEERHTKAVELVTYLKKEIEFLERVVYEQNVSNEHKKLLEENKNLKEQLQLWQNKVVKLESEQGIKQIAIPGNAKKSKSISHNSSSVSPFDVEPSTVENSAPKSEEFKSLDEDKKVKKEISSKKKEKDIKKKDKDDSADINVGRLLLRVGKIVSIEKHPDADSLYVEKIDVDEMNGPRTVISGLVKYVPIEKMQDRLVVVICNMKPVKMRGILSEGMVLCASTPDKVELLNPPPDAIAGDYIVCPDHLGNPDLVLNPKKKIFEQIAPDLKTNDDCVATYKSSPLFVVGKGYLKADSLANVPIK